MTILELVQQDHPVLREPTAPVTIFDDELQGLIDDMIETMREAEGVGLAAPQIGRSLRLAVVETPPETDDEGEPLPDTRELFVLVNPKIVWESRKKVDGVEGCLSIPGYLGEVTRSHAVRIQAQDRTGKRRRFSVNGWDARIVQHELDHLEGVLYIDKLTAPDNFWSEEEYAEMMEAEAEAAEAAAEAEAAMD